MRPIECGPWPMDAEGDDIAFTKYAHARPYLARRIGHDHLGIGSDFYGWVNPDGLEDTSVFPALIKPSFGDSSVGITEHSVVRSADTADSAAAGAVFTPYQPMTPCRRNPW